MAWETHPGRDIVLKMFSSHLKCSGEHAFLGVLCVPSTNQHHLVLFFLATFLVTKLARSRWP